jgi:hypothetical protein
MATEGTKFQINYKLADGTLINLYAANVQELETGLTDLSMVSTLIASTSYELAKRSVFDSAPGGPAAPTVAAVAQAFNATPVQAAPAPAQSGGGNTCKHGVMALRSGVGQKGPWSGYMCAAPKGAPDKCDTIWVR